MFDIEAYREHLYQLVAEQKISRLTADGYVGCLERLDEKIRPDQGIAEVIRELCKNTQQGGKYIAAVKKYERDIQLAESGNTETVQAGANRQGTGSARADVFTQNQQVE